MVRVEPDAPRTRRSTPRAAKPSRFKRNEDRGHELLGERGRPSRCMSVHGNSVARPTVRLMYVGVPTIRNAATHDTPVSTRRRWSALALIVTAQFMVMLDVAIVNVALPSIKADLGFSQASLQWVITAYAILFGGALLLGGRLADLLGRRRIFIAGLAVFSIELAPVRPRLVGGHADRASVRCRASAARCSRRRRCRS